MSVDDEVLEAANRVTREREREREGEKERKREREREKGRGERREERDVLFAAMLPQ